MAEQQIDFKIFVENIKNIESQKNVQDQNFLFQKLYYNFNADDLKFLLYNFKPIKLTIKNIIKFLNTFLDEKINYEKDKMNKRQLLETYLKNVDFKNKDLTILEAKEFLLKYSSNEKDAKISALLEYYQTFNLDNFLLLLDFAQTRRTIPLYILNSVFNNSQIVLGIFVEYPKPNLKIPHILNDIYCHQQVETYQLHKIDNEYIIFNKNGIILNNNKLDCVKFFDTYFNNVSKLILIFSYDKDKVEIHDCLYYEENLSFKSLIIRRELIESHLNDIKSPCPIYISEDQKFNNINECIDFMKKVPQTYIIRPIYSIFDSTNKNYYKYISHKKLLSTTLTFVGKNKNKIILGAKKDNKLKLILDKVCIKNNLYKKISEFEYDNIHKDNIIDVIDNMEYLKTPINVNVDIYGMTNSLVIIMNDETESSDILDFDEFEQLFSKKIKT